jgi:L-ascorbate metabolism protein UlaG (beta-lactamase superfamily)
MSAIKTIKTILATFVAAMCSSCQVVPALPSATEVGSHQEPGLIVRSFGTSTLTVSDGTTTVMIDGFFSRPGLLRLGLAWTGLPLLSPNQERLTQALAVTSDQNVDAIFVAHSHHDHVLDTAYVARAKNAAVYGSASSLNVVLGQDASIETHEILNGDTTEVGAFRITVLASPHKMTMFGPAGDITSPLHLPAKLRAFKSGPSFAFHIAHERGDVLIVPSAVIDGDGPAIGNSTADVVLLGIGMLGRESEVTMARYWTKVVCPTKANRVHPIHWDNFMRPLSKPLTPFPFDRLDRSVRILSSFAQADAIEFSYLPFATPITLPNHDTQRTRSSFCPAK